MKKAGELLGSFFDEGLLRSAKGYSDFFTSWKGIVGDHLAAHSRIVELEKTVLVVEADHPGWIQLIQLKRSSILDAIRKKFPELSITTISIKLSKFNSVDTSLPKKQRPVERLEKVEMSEQKILNPASGCDRKTKETDPYTNISDESFKDLLRKLEISIKKASR